MDGKSHPASAKGISSAPEAARESPVQEQDFSQQDRSRLVEEMREWACSVSSKENHNEFLQFATKYLETLIR